MNLYLFPKLQSTIAFKILLHSVSGPYLQGIEGRVTLEKVHLLGQYSVIRAKEGEEMGTRGHTILRVILHSEELAPAYCCRLLFVVR